MNQPKPARNEFEDLGERLVRLGEALQDATSSVGYLNQLARECGIKLRLRVVAEGEGAIHG